MRRRLPPRPEKAERASRLSRDADFLAAAIAAADRAGDIIRPYFRTATEARLKSDLSPVTAADREAEQAMRDLLTKAFPTHGVLGEEYGVWNPDAAYRWVLDPIDGTRAFITGRPMFGTLVALLHEGMPILGIIDQPVTGERWIGQAGAKTSFRGPFGGSAGTRQCRSLATAELSCTSPELLGPSTPSWRRLADQAGRVSWGGDCYAYGLLALGQIDVVAECGMQPWDWAALVPVIEGAGGSVTDWGGARLSMAGDGSVLAVGDIALLPACVAALSGTG